MTVNGLTTPLLLVARFLFVCVGARDLSVASYWIDTLVLQKLREIITLLYCITLSSPRENQRSAQGMHLAMSLARGYNSDPGVNHWTTVKIILRGLRKYFSVMEVIKSSS